MFPTVVCNSGEVVKWFTIRGFQPCGGGFNSPSRYVGSTRKARKIKVFRRRIYKYETGNRNHTTDSGPKS